MSPKGRDHGTCTVRTHPSKSIAFAVGKARKGDTVEVTRGTYREMVTVARDIRLVGRGRVVMGTGPCAAHSPAARACT